MHDSIIVFKCWVAMILNETYFALKKIILEWIKVGEMKIQYVSKWLLYIVASLLSQITSTKDT